LVDADDFAVVRTFATNSLPNVEVHNVEYIMKFIPNEKWPACSAL
jgi:hypothetical protein